MNRPSCAKERGAGPPRISCRRPVLALVALVAASCTVTTPTWEPRGAPIADAAEYVSEGIRIRLVGKLQAGDPGTLIEEPGWAEYILTIDNRADNPLAIYNIKLLSLEGRYLDSAASYEQVTAAPDVASEVAGMVATSAAGAAAGQVIPYGGAIVGIISGTVSASAAKSDGSGKREFALRKLKDVELAPGGKMTGSAFFPQVTNAKALVVDYGRGNLGRRIEIPLSRS